MMNGWPPISLPNPTFTSGRFLVDDRPPNPLIFSRSWSILLSPSAVLALDVMYER
jgi:hypothetical protein